MSLHLSLITAVISTSSLKQKPKKSDEEKELKTLINYLWYIFLLLLNQVSTKSIFCYNNPQM